MFSLKGNENKFDNFCNNNQKFKKLKNQPKDNLFLNRKGNIDSENVHVLSLILYYLFIIIY